MATLGVAVAFLIWIGTMGPAQASAWGSWVQAVAVVLALAFGAAQLSEMRRVREEQVRPNVSVRLELEVETYSAYFVVHNYGASSARELKFTFDPPIKTSHDVFPHQHDTDCVAHPSQWLLFRGGIDVLAPGEQIRTAFELMKRWNEFRNDLPKRFDVDIHYKNANDEQFGPERFVLDVEMLSQLMHVESGDSVKNQTKKMASSIEKIEKHLARGLANKAAN